MSQFIEMFKDNYPMQKWDDCLSITNGKRYDDEYQESGLYPICGSAGVMGFGNKKLCDKDTVILGRKGNINSPIYMEQDYWIVDTAFSLAVDKQKLQPKYFFYWCKQFDFMKYNKQGVLPSLTKNDLLKIELPIPPIKLQNKFVSILEQADKSEFDGFKSQFIEMFKDVSNRVTLDKVVDIKDDCRKPINDSVRSTMKNGELFPYYGATGVVDYINDYITNERLLCIAEDCGNYKAGEESSYIIVGKAWVNNHAHVVKPKDTCTIEYLHQYLKILDLMPYVSGTTRLKLTQQKLKEISVILPDKERQIEFVTITKQADKSENHCEFRMAS